MPMRLLRTQAWKLQVMVQLLDDKQPLSLRRHLCQLDNIRSPHVSARVALPYAEFAGAMLEVDTYTGCSTMQSEPLCH